MRDGPAPAPRGRRRCRAGRDPFPTRRTSDAWRRAGARPRSAGSAATRTTGPRGVAPQSRWRIRAPISPPAGQAVPDGCFRPLHGADFIIGGRAPVSGRVRGALSGVVPVQSLARALRGVTPRPSRATGTERFTSRVAARPRIAASRGCSAPAPPPRPLPAPGSPGRSPRRAGPRGGPRRSCRRSPRRGRTCRRPRRSDGLVDPAQRLGFHLHERVIHPAHEVLHALLLGVLDVGGPRVGNASRSERSLLRMSACRSVNIRLNTS